MKRLLLIGVLLLSPALSFAEGGTCPPGYYPHNIPGVMGCAPIPGYGGGARPVDPGPQWETRWGTVAIDHENGAFGSAEAASTPRQAKRRAKAACKAQGGRNCRVGEPYFNQCIAVAWGDAWISTYSAETVARASLLAVEDCSLHTGDCQIFYSACSLPVRVR